MPYEIDNPAGGDCGWYAFSIGLINIIQQEYRLHARSKTYENWHYLGLYHESLESIVNFDLQKLRRDPTHYQKALLNSLQMALRGLAVYASKQALEQSINIERGMGEENQTKVESTQLFGKFLQLVRYHQGDEASLEELSKFNELALCNETVALAKQTAEEFPKDQFVDALQEHAIVKEAFLLDVAPDGNMAPDSIILNGAEKVSEAGRWPTDTDLAAVAAQLKVNLLIENKMIGMEEPEYSTVSLRHKGNHWTTLVDEPSLAAEEAMFSAKQLQIINTTVSAQKHPEKVARYRGHVEALIQVSAQGLFAHVSKKIDVNEIDNEQALSEERDEDYAMRLQEAELRRVKLL